MPSYFHRYLHNEGVFTLLVDHRINRHNLTQQSPQTTPEEDILTYSHIENPTNPDDETQAKLTENWKDHYNMGVGIYLETSKLALWREQNKCLPFSSNLHVTN